MPAAHHGEPTPKRQRLILHPTELLNLAGALTLLRLPLAVLFPFVAHRADLALAVYWAAVLSDVLDGPVARRTGKTSQIGAFADGWLDKIFHIQAAWSLVIFDWIPGWWMLLWFIRELIQGAAVPWYVGLYMRGEVPPNQPSRAGRLTAISLAGAFTCALLRLETLALLLTLITGAGGLIAAAGYLYREFEHRSRHR